MMGMLECATKYLIILAVVIYAVQWVGNWFDWGVDDSDLDAWNRSGLKIHVDAKTGEEYLSDGRGGLVIRYPTSASKQ